jgi:NAD(P)-dependent dehydrogenase (short-subunit alcohol dehydrogenase family)
MSVRKLRTAIVTGAGKRVGRAIAEALLADRWTVIGHVRRESDVVPEGAIRVVSDLADRDSAATIVAAAEGHAPLGLLVNNAARFSPDRLEAFSPDEFAQHMSVNVRAPTELIAAFADASPGNGDRLVVNILDAKLAAPNPDFLSYTLSKHAAGALTELAARALAGRGVRVNAIAPALMLRSPGQDAANFAAVHRHNPLGRGVTPEDVVTALRYFIDSPSVTGQVIAIDGGQRFWSLDRDVQFLAEQS